MATEAGIVRPRAHTLTNPSLQIFPCEQRTLFRVLTIDRPKRVGCQVGEVAQRGSFFAVEMPEHVWADDLADESVDGKFRDTAEESFGNGFFSLRRAATFLRV